MSVNKYDGDFETSGDVCAYQGLEVLEYVIMYMLSSLPAGPNLMYPDIVIRNMMPTTFMMSTDRVTILYCCMTKTEIEVFTNLIFADTCPIVLPFTHTRSVPKMNSTLLISCMVTGQFGISF